MIHLRLDSPWVPVTCEGCSGKSASLHKLEGTLITTKGLALLREEGKFFVIIFRDTKKPAPAPLGEILCCAQDKYKTKLHIKGT